MNGLYRLRRRDTERDPMEGPLFPNVPGPPPPQIKDISQPQTDETENALLNAMKIIQSLKGQPAKDEETPKKDNVLSQYMGPRKQSLASVTEVPGLKGEIDYSSRFPGGSIIYDSSMAGTIEGVPSYKYVNPELFAGRTQEEQRKIYRALYSDPAFREMRSPIGLGEAAGLREGTGAEGYVSDMFPPVRSAPGYNIISGPPIPGTTRVRVGPSTWDKFKQYLGIPYTKGTGYYDKVTNPEKFMDWADIYEGTERDYWTTPERKAAREAALDVAMGGGITETTLAPIPVQNRQRGGPIQKDQPYFVGEEGPEIILPQSDGTVIPSPAVAPDLTENTLRNLAMTNPNLSFKNFITPNMETTSQNAVLDAVSRTPTPETKKPANSLLDYWAKPVIGKMPLDQFVQIAGALSSAIAPREWSGRVGANLAQMGGAAYAERVRREAPENILKQKLMEAQITKLGEPKTLGEWQTIWSSLEGKVNPDTGKIYTPDEKVRHIKELTKTPKEPISHVSTPFESGGLMWQTITKDGKVETVPLIPGEARRPSVTTEGITETPLGPPQGQLKGKTGTPLSDIGKLQYDREALVKTYGKDSPVVKAIDDEIIKRSKGTEGAPTLKEEFKNIGGVPHKRQIEWDSATKKWIPKGDWIRTEKPAAPDKPEYTPKQAMARISMIDSTILRLKTTGTIDTSIAIQNPFLASYLAGRTDTKDPEAVKQAIATLENERAEVIKYVPKGYGEKVAPEIFKDAQGRELVKDPTSTSGWRFKASPQGLPDGSKIIGKSKKSGNPVYQLPDGSTKEMIQ